MFSASFRRPERQPDHLSPTAAGPPLVAGIDGGVNLDAQTEN